MKTQVIPTPPTGYGRWYEVIFAARRNLIVLTGAVLLLSPAAVSAQVPPAIAALAKKYDEARQKTLGPLLDNFADDLKLKTVPALTRAGKADAAIEIDQAATQLKGAGSAAIPREGAPFSPSAWAVVRETAEWTAFAETFAKEESSLNDLYKNALDREKAAFQAKGDPYGVLAVENEVKRVDAILAAGVPAVSEPRLAAARATAPANPPAGEAAAAPMVSKIDRAQAKEIEARFVGKLWKTPQWKDEIHEWYFRKNGEVVRKIIKTDGKVAGLHTMTWTLDPDSTVGVAMESPAPKYFWFAADGTAEYRQHEKEGVRGPITLVPDGKDPGE